ncbi:MAG: VWA domain-containing protein [Planctomycetes bacterium]|nr:VWA domain-containing protein [Planctomycetota bacterium]
MKRLSAYACVVAGFIGSLTATELRAQSSVPVRESTPVEAPRVEVCFVLDTTGSMSGLIAGAKAKIWAIANQMIAAEPTPRLRIALVGFRDRGDDYITRLFDLTEDIDAVYKNLQGFAANGGGDGPESVNQALAEAVTQIDWTPDRSVLKIVFLVGDSPPHMDYPDDVKYADTCQVAVKNDLIINTVQCGTNAVTTPIWREIAKRAEGKYVAIGQTGNMQVIATPMDGELARLNAEVGTTLVPYGSVEARLGVAAKQAASEEAESSVAADRLAYGIRAGRAVSGGGDLVDALREGHVKLETLKKEELPAEMQAMSVEQQRDYIKQQSEKRGQLQRQVAELLKQRQAHIDAEMKKLAQSGQRDAFDTKVAELIREQGQRKGIKYADASATPPGDKP